MGEMTHGLVYGSGLQTNTLRWQVFVGMDGKGERKINGFLALFGRRPTFHADDFFS